MNALLFNREFAFDPNEEVEVLRSGDYPHSSGIVQVIDDLAHRTIEAQFNAEKQRQNFPGLLVDFDHFSSDVTKPSEAAGWITNLRQDGDRLLAKVNWSRAGEDAVRSGRYRLLSPVFNRHEMEAIANKRYRPLRLDSVGLTNAPNMRGLAPISNRSAVLDVSTVTPQRAGEHFRAEVEQVKKAHGWTFDQAWNYCRQEHSALHNRMAAQSDSLPQNPTTVPKAANDDQNLISASQRFLTLVQNRATTSGTSFCSAWDAMSLEYPDLWAKSAGLVFNRDGVGSSADFKRAEKRADEVLNALLADLETVQYPDRGESISNDAALRGAFKREFQRLIESGLSAERAFSEIKSTEPIFWQRFVLNYHT